MGLEPLSVPELDRIDAEITGAERFWKHLPILGWGIAGAKWDARTNPIAEKVERQLRERSAPPDAIWGDDPERVAVARCVCRVAQAEMGWPNDRFIPGDPVDVVFWAHNDGLDFDVAVLEIADHLGTEISIEESRAWFGLTLGDVVSWLLERKPADRHRP